MTLSDPIVCGPASNILAEPEAEGQILKDRGIVYAPDFVANAGGVIRLAGLYLGLTETQVDEKVERIEETSLEVPRRTESHASAYDAAFAYARERIDAGRSAATA